MPRPPIAPPLLAVLLLVLFARAAAAFTTAEAKLPMTATLVRSDAAGCGADCPEWLALTGLIGPGSPALFSAALGRLGRRNVPVLVDSPGGSVEAAMAIGRTVRARRMTVVVAGTALTDCAPADGACAARRRAGERPGFVAGGVAACASACVLILAAGTERSVADHSYVGVHQMTARRTLTRVMNYFRIVRRMVDGRPVEISRTLIGTKPISTRTTVGAASESAYSEVDRYLLGLGIAESIMPLMRSAPPSGIHWMTPAELAATRIATDTTDARTLVERAAPAGSSPSQPRPAAPPSVSPGIMALAAAALGDGRRTGGIVTWRIDGGAGDPRLVASIEIPERHLRGTLSLVRDTAPGTPGGFLASTDFGPPEAIEAGRMWAVEAPRFCDPTGCDLPFAAPSESDDGRGRRTFRAGAAAGDRFLSGLRDKAWISVPLSADDGTRGWLSVSIDKDIRAVVGDWECRCCGLAAPAPPLSGASGATLVKRVAPGAGPSPSAATATWTELPGLAAPRPGQPCLLGSIDVDGAGLLLSLQAGLAPGDAMGGVAVALQISPDVARFGPVTDLTVEPITAADGRLAMIGAAYRYRYGGFDVTLAPSAPLPDGTTLALDLSDARGRTLRIAVPMPDALAKLLAASVRARA